MELPYHLKTLEPLPSALDIIRFLGAISAPNADMDEICDGLDISDRRFSKAIRRLVTKGYVQMDGDLIYRLNERGQEAAETLKEYDANAPADDDSDDAAAVEAIKRRLILAIPHTLVAQQANPIFVGLAGGDNDATLNPPADMVVRLSVTNGEPSTPEESLIKFADQPIQQGFSVTPGTFDRARIRVQIFQLGPNPDDINVCGGLYVDADVSAGAANTDFVAYGTDLAIQVLD